MLPLTLRARIPASYSKNLFKDADGNFRLFDERLYGQYTVVGRVISGMDVVDAIKRGEGENGAVTDPDQMAKVTIAP